MSEEKELTTEKQPKTYLSGESKKLKDGKDIVAIATDPTEDRDGEVIEPKGVDVKDYSRNPILLFGHQHNTLPIGKAENLRLEGEQWKFSPVFSEATQMSREVKALHDEGVLRAWSIGFIPEERDGNKWTKSKLLEISLVNVPSNPAALTIARSKGLNIGLVEPENEEEVKEEKGSPNLAKFPVEKDWDADEAKKRIKKYAGGPDKETIDWAKYGQAFAYVDSENDKNYAGYKLPFADVDGESLKAVWRGVATAMAALLGARGGVDLEEEDRRKVYSLLSGYYKKFEKEAPEFRSYESEDEVFTALFEKKIDPETAKQVLSVLHPNTSEGEPPESDLDVDNLRKAKVDAKLNAAFHLFVQQMSKQTNYMLKRVNDVRRKERRRDTTGRSGEAGKGDGPSISRGKQEA